MDAEGPPAELPFPRSGAAVFIGWQLREVGGSFSRKLEMHEFVKTYEKPAACSRPR